MDEWAHYPVLHLDHYVVSWDLEEAVRFMDLFWSPAIPPDAPGGEVFGPFPATIAEGMYDKAIQDITTGVLSLKGEKDVRGKTRYYVEPLSDPQFL